MAKNKKAFSIASLDASKLKNVDTPIVKDGHIKTYPVRDAKEVPLGCLPEVSFPKGSVNQSSLTYENVFVVDALGKKVPATVIVKNIIDDTVSITPNELLKPGVKYFFNFSNKLRDVKGKKISAIDNSISFTTAKG